MTSFERAVSALVYALVAEHCASTMPSGRFRQNDVVRFVLRQCALMPDYLRPPIRIMTLMFDWAGMGRHGRRFHRLELQDRQRQIARWRDSRLAPLADLIRFYEGLAVFGWYALRDSDANIAAARSDSHG